MNKIIHGCLHTIGLVMVIVGLIAAFLSHNSVTHGGMKPNLYTAHGFVGIFVVTLFFFQYIMGISAFVVPAIRTKIASAWVPLHRFLGTFCYFGALMAAGMGIAEKTDSMPPLQHMFNQISTLLCITRRWEQDTRLRLVFPLRFFSLLSLPRLLHMTFQALILSL